jgi:hypothetical protein
VVNARGGMFIHTIRFVEETFGADAHHKIVATLPASAASALTGVLREASWMPVAHLVAYMEAAKALCAPENATFFRRVGYYSGCLARTQGGFGPMVATPETANRLASTMWRAFFDAGRLAIEVPGPKAAVGRLCDFPTSRTLCQRIEGAVAGLLRSEAGVAHVEHIACAADGSPHCELHVRWD